MIIYQEPVPVKMLVALIIFCVPVIFCQVHNFCSLLSDAHNPVSLKLNLNVLIQNANISNSIGSHKRLWDASKVEEYTASFDQQSVDNLISNLSELETHESVQQSDQTLIRLLEV